MSLEFQNAEMEAATTLLSLRLEPGRPAPLRRCNALSASDSAGGSTETGANACEGGAARPETPVYTPEDEEEDYRCDYKQAYDRELQEQDEDDSHCECPCGANCGADCDCWEEQFHEDSGQTEGGDVSVPSEGS